MRMGAGAPQCLIYRARRVVGWDLHGHNFLIACLARYFRGYLQRLCELLDAPCAFYLKSVRCVAFVADVGSLAVSGESDLIARRSQNPLVALVGGSVWRSDGYHRNVQMRFQLGARSCGFLKQIEAREIRGRDVRRQVTAELYAFLMQQFDRPPVHQRCWLAIGGIPARRGADPVGDDEDFAVESFRLQNRPCNVGEVLISIIEGNEYGTSGQWNLQFHRFLKLAGSHAVIAMGAQQSQLLAEHIGVYAPTAESRWGVGRDAVIGQDRNLPASRMRHQVRAAFPRATPDDLPCERGIQPAIQVNPANNGRRSLGGFASSETVYAIEVGYNRTLQRQALGREECLMDHLAAILLVPVEAGGGHVVFEYEGMRHDQAPLGSEGIAELGGDLDEPVLSAEIVENFRANDQRLIAGNVVGNKVKQPEACIAAVGASIARALKGESGDVCGEQCSGMLRQLFRENAFRACELEDPLKGFGRQKIQRTPILGLLIVANIVPGIGPGKDLVPVSGPCLRLTRNRLDEGWSARHHGRLPPRQRLGIRICPIC